MQLEDNDDGLSMEPTSTPREKKKRAASLSDEGSVGSSLYEEGAYAQTGSKIASKAVKWEDIQSNPQDEDIVSFFEQTTLDQWLQDRGFIWFKQHLSELCVTQFGHVSQLTSKDIEEFVEECSKMLPQDMSKFTLTKFKRQFIRLKDFYSKYDQLINMGPGHSSNNLGIDNNNNNGNNAHFRGQSDNVMVLSDSEKTCYVEFKQKRQELSSIKNKNPLINCAHSIEDIQLALKTKLEFLSDSMSQNEAICLQKWNFGNNLVNGGEVENKENADTILLMKNDIAQVTNLIRFTMDFEKTYNDLLTKCMSKLDGETTAVCICFGFFIMIIFLFFLFFLVF